MIPQGITVWDCPNCGTEMHYILKGKYGKKHPMILQCMSCGKVSVVSQKTYDFYMYRYLKAVARRTGSKRLKEKLDKWLKTGDIK